MEIWFHLANILYVVSYLVTDILWLRALAVLGGLSSLTWTLTTPTPSATFTSGNAVRYGVWKRLNPSGPIMSGPTP